MINLTNINDEFSNYIDEIQNAGGIEFTDIQPIDLATDNSLVFANNEKFLNSALGSKAKIIITKTKLKDQCSESDKTIIYSPLPDLLVSFILRKYFYTKDQVWSDTTGVSESATVSDQAKLGKDCFVGNHSQIHSDVEIGNNVYIGSNVIINEGVRIDDNSVVMDQSWIGQNTRIGKRAILRSATSIGVDSFDSFLTKEKCSGSVLIGDDFETGSQCCIDRPIKGETIIGNGVKLDNLVKIADLCNIGDNSLITAGVQIGKSVKIGKYFMIGGNSYVEANTVVADGVLCGGITYIDKDIDKAGAYGGNPVQPMKEYLRTLASFSQLPKLRKLLRSQ